MKKLTVSNTKPSIGINALRALCVNKVAALLATVAALFLFGDTLLPLFGHILHILVELIESAAEHLLVHLFHLSKRQAELVVFYSGLLIALKLLWIYSRKAYFNSLRVYTSFQARQRARLRLAESAVWFRVILTLGTLGTTVFLFT